MFLYQTRLVGRRCRRSVRHVERPCVSHGQRACGLSSLVVSFISATRRNLACRFGYRTCSRLDNRINHERQDAARRNRPRILGKNPPRCCSHLYGTGLCEHHGRIRIGRPRTRMRNSVWRRNGDSTMHLGAYCCSWRYLSRTATVDLGLRDSVCSRRNRRHVAVNRRPCARQPASACMVRLPACPITSASKHVIGARGPCSLLCEHANALRGYIRIRRIHGNPWF